MTEHSRRDVASLLSALGFIALGGLALYYTKDMSPLGSVFPRTIGSAMIVFSIAYIGWRWFKPHLGAEAIGGGSHARRALLAAIMIAWALLLDRLGFLSASIIAALLLLAVANYDRWTPIRAMAYLASTLAIVFGLYAVFRYGLLVPLPTGALF
ncbi:C4-dicarboxylate ABC transporter permease [Sulfurifustis variabilis]|uniref:C4-dicarboxylate ABC transporter permease n=1 Tax=Sulfurifustis variabilis TaxID=1675686 RepID=A0A1B4V4F9_9GAMM|nr:tripartite tricarboxylate transporter TctB family protein [Sulfurifustis variabilis]BAU48399.1 C4-dicarboxylate ABC transporter permease [Sulfurifustis variabilis]